MYSKNVLGLFSSTSQTYCLFAFHSSNNLHSPASYIPPSHACLKKSSDNYSDPEPDPIWNSIEIPPVIIDFYHKREQHHQPSFPVTSFKPDTISSILSSFAYFFPHFPPFPLTVPLSSFLSVSHSSLHPAPPPLSLFSSTISAEEYEWVWEYCAENKSLSWHSVLWLQTAVYVSMYRVLRV